MTGADLAQVSGINATRQRLFFMGVLAGFCALALQAVGSLLISGLLILRLEVRLWLILPQTNGSVCPYFSAAGG